MIDNDDNQLDEFTRMMIIKTWNTAIEDAAKVAQKERHNVEMIEEIRKLKKDVTS